MDVFMEKTRHRSCTPNLRPKQHPMNHYYPREKLFNGWNLKLAPRKKMMDVSFGYHHHFRVPKMILVGGWTNSLEKYYFPKDQAENKTYLSCHHPVILRDVSPYRTFIQVVHRSTDPPINSYGCQGTCDVSVRWWHVVPFRSAGSYFFPKSFERTGPGMTGNIPLAFGILGGICCNSWDISWVEKTLECDFLEEFLEVPSMTPWRIEQCWRTIQNGARIWSLNRRILNVQEWM